MKKSELIAITGGLSNPSKMPGKAYSLPARACITGSKLRNVPGSVCASCYACKGRYVFGNVQRALYRRLQIVETVTAAGSNSKLWWNWIRAMAESIGSDRFFRFHDSGDIQSAAHLDLYCALAAVTPSTSYWLPTKEAQTVKRYTGRIPNNLTVRISAAMVNAPAPAAVGRFPVSLVWDSTMPLDNPPAHVTVCPARHQGNVCGDCRACWDSAAPVVVYPKH